MSVEKCPLQLLVDVDVIDSTGSSSPVNCSSSDAMRHVLVFNRELVATVVYFVMFRKCTGLVDR